MYTLKGKVVLITGALTSVGRKLARELISDGARVSLVDSINDGSGETFSHQLNSEHGQEEEKSIYVQTDLRSLHDIRLMIDATILNFGRMDVLVNNAERYTENLSGEEDAQRICDSIDVNLRAPIVATWVFSRYLRESGIDGVVVNVTAMAGLLPGRGREVYGAAKAGLIHFTEANWSLAPRIRVCALAPYYVDNVMDMTENKRLLPGNYNKLSEALTLSSGQVVRAVMRCIKDTRLTGRTVLVAGDSSYSHTWYNLLSYIQMFFIMLWSLIALLGQRIYETWRRHV